LEIPKGERRDTCEAIPANTEGKWCDSRERPALYGWAWGLAPLARKPFDSAPDRFFPFPALSRQTQLQHAREQRPCIVSGGYILSGLGRSCSGQFMDGLVLSARWQHRRHNQPAGSGSFYKPIEVKYV